MDAMHIIPIYKMGFTATLANLLEWSEKLVDFPLIPVPNDRLRICTVNPKFSKKPALSSLINWGLFKLNTKLLRQFIRLFPIKWYLGNSILAMVELFCVIHLKFLTEAFFSNEKLSWNFMEEYLAYNIMAAFFLLGVVSCYQAELEPSVCTAQVNALATKHGIVHKGKKIFTFK